ncbi:MAG: permease [Candidatus Krumholzibacteriia bacterium]
MSRRAARALVGGIARAWPWLAPAAVVALWARGHARGAADYGQVAGVSLAHDLLEMATILPPMFILVALFDVWVPREFVARRVGRGTGVGAMAWMVLLAMMQAGPLYVAFPVAISLWRKGCAPRNVFVYIGAFSALKIPLLSFEVAFLGWRFSLARSLISLPVFVLLALLMERLLPRDYRPPGCDEPDRAT